MIRHIPNTITLMNLCCGAISAMLLSVCILTDHPDSVNYINYSFGLMWGSLLLDFFDGFAARLLHVQSEIGKQLDSLADMVSFGLVPGLASILLLKGTGLELPFAFIGILVCCFSALRLAIFNIDESQSDNFKGLATPSVTLFIISILYLIEVDQSVIYSSIFQNTASLIAMILICSYLLVSSIPMFSFKFKNKSLSDNLHRFILIGIALVSFAFLQVAAFPLIIVIYILLSFIFKKKIN